MRNDRIPTVFRPRIQTVIPMIVSTDTMDTECTLRVMMKAGLLMCLRQTSGILQGILRGLL